MKRDPWRQAAQDLRWRVALLVFAVLAAVGGACALWALQELRGSGTRAAGADAQALAQSVAQTLAQQLGRAVRLGIPLHELPGVQPYLQAALQRQPALTHIAIESADGAVVHAAGSPAQPHAAAGAVRVPIAGAGSGAQAGAVLVGSDPGASLQQRLRRARWQAACLVLALAGAAALAAACGPGARMERQRRQVQERLAHGSGEGAAHAPGAGLVDDTARGLPALAQTLAQGHAQSQAAQRAVQDYAQELLAMDFDGRMRPAIDRLMHERGAMPPAGD